MKGNLPHVAIGGKMRVGKTTCAEHLVSCHGYRRYAIADPIKDLARTGFGWDGRKDDRGRRLLQELGSAGRAYERRIWLRRFDEWFAAHGDVPVVVDDVRLVNEVEHFRRRRFLLIGLRRPTVPGGAGDAVLRAHETETELERADFDVVVVNVGTIPDLLEKLDRAVLAESTAAR